MGKKDSASVGKPKKDQNESFRKSMLSVEPALVLHMGAGIMVFMVLQDLLLEKACRVNLQYGDDVCNALQARKTGSYAEEEKKVQTLIGTAMFYRTILENLFPIVLVFLIGAWSDRYGRKLPMLFVVTAFIIQNVCLILCVYFANTAGVWTVALVSSIIPGLSGHQACFMMSAFAYLSDTTPPEKRTSRNAIAHSFIFLGITVGLASGGILAKSTLGFTNIFAIGIAVEAFVLLHIVTMIKTIRDDNAIKGKSTKGMLLELFDMRHIVDSWKAILKKREGNKRLKIWLLCFVHICSMSPTMGEMSVSYLFSRYQFNWDASDYGNFMTYKMILGFFSNFISMALLTNYFKLGDSGVGVVCCFSTLLSLVFYAFCNVSAMMFIGPLLALLAGPTMIIARTVMSKVVDASDIGKVMSFLSSLDSVITLLAGSVYTTVYTATLHILPGAFYLVSAGLMIPSILIHAWFISKDTQIEKRKKKE